MPHPKRRKSKAKRDKRRTHYKGIIPQLTICPLNRQIHLYHRAYWYNNNLYYRGKVILQN